MRSFVLILLFFWFVLSLVLSLSLSPLFKVHKSISWSLDAAVQRLLVQKRNTDNLLLGNKIRIDDYFSKTSALKYSRYQNNSSAMQVLHLQQVCNPITLKWFLGSYMYLCTAHVLSFSPFVSVLPVLYIFLISSRLHLFCDFVLLLFALSNAITDTLAATVHILCKTQVD